MQTRKYYGIINIVEKLSTKILKGDISMYIPNKKIEILNDTINTCTKLDDDMLEYVSGGFKAKHIGYAAAIGGAIGAIPGLILDAIGITFFIIGGIASYQGGKQK